jgi:hypothetical protein
MTYAQLQKAFKAQPGFSLWLRLFGVKPEDDVTGAGMLTIEVLDALYRYQLVPRPWVLGVDAFDFVSAWAGTLGGDLRGQIVCVVNGRYLMLGSFIVVDVRTGKKVDPPARAAPVLTAALHLQPLRDQTEARLEIETTVEASVARGE